MTHDQRNLLYQAIEHARIEGARRTLTTLRMIAHLEPKRNKPMIDTRRECSRAGCGKQAGGSGFCSARCERLIGAGVTS